MNLLDTLPGEVVADTSEARDRAERIRGGLVALGTLTTDIAAAYQRRDWFALGYESWEAYVAGEFGTDRVRLDREQRREVVANLKAESMSTRAIASVLGVTHPTVIGDLRAGGKDLPPAERTPVAGLDGKTYSSSQPTPRSDWQADIFEAELVDNDQDDEAPDEPFNDEAEHERAFDDTAEPPLPPPFVGYDAIVDDKAKPSEPAPVPETAPAPSEVDREDYERLLARLPKRPASQVDQATVYAVARQEYLNAYSQGIDGLVYLESYTKSYTPPANIPDPYPSVATVVDRIEKVLSTWRAWRDSR